MKRIIFLFLIVFQSSFCLKKDIKREDNKKLLNNCRKIKCPTVEEPVCVKLKQKNLEVSEKPIYIMMINKCELQYVKCHKGVEAIIVPMNNCEHHTKEAKKRGKREAMKDTMFLKHMLGDKIHHPLPKKHGKSKSQEDNKKYPETYRQSSNDDKVPRQDPINKLSNKPHKKEDVMFLKQMLASDIHHPLPAKKNVKSNSQDRQKQRRIKYPKKDRQSSKYDDVIFSKKKLSNKSHKKDTMFLKQMLAEDIYRPLPKKHVISNSQDTENDQQNHENDKKYPVIDRQSSKDDKIPHQDPKTKLSNKSFKTVEKPMFLKQMLEEDIYHPIPVKKNVKIDSQRTENDHQNQGDYQKYPKRDHQPPEDNNVPQQYHINKLSNKPHKKDVMFLKQMLTDDIYRPLPKKHGKSKSQSTENDHQNQGDYQKDPKNYRQSPEDDNVSPQYSRNKLSNKQNYKKDSMFRQKMLAKNIDNETRHSLVAEQYVESMSQEAGNRQQNRGDNQYSDKEQSPEGGHLHREDNSVSTQDQYYKLSNKANKQQKMFNNLMFAEKEPPSFQDSKNIHKHSESDQENTKNGQQYSENEQKHLGSDLQNSGNSQEKQLSENDDQRSENDKQLSENDKQLSENDTQLSENDEQRSHNEHELNQKDQDNKLSYKYNENGDDDGPEGYKSPQYDYDPKSEPEDFDIDADFPGNDDNPTNDKDSNKEEVYEAEDNGQAPPPSIEASEEEIEESAPNEDLSEPPGKENGEDYASIQGSDGEKKGDDPVLSDLPVNGEDYDSIQEVDMKEYESDCPSVCPSRDMMVCAKSAHGVYRTFMSVCHMRMYSCAHKDEQPRLVSRYPCMMTAPYFSRELNMRPKGHVQEPNDYDKVLKFLECRKKGILGKRNCVFD